MLASGIAELTAAGMPPAVSRRTGLPLRLHGDEARDRGGAELIPLFMSVDDCEEVVKEAREKDAALQISPPSLSSVAEHLRPRGRCAGLDLSHRPARRLTVALTLARGSTSVWWTSEPPCTRFKAVESSPQSVDQRDGLELHAFCERAKWGPLGWCVSLWHAIGVRASRLL